MCIERKKEGSHQVGKWIYNFTAYNTNEFSTELFSRGFELQIFISLNFLLTVYWYHSDNWFLILDLIQMNVREVIWMEISTLFVGTLNWFLPAKSHQWTILLPQLQSWMKMWKLRYRSQSLTSIGNFLYILSIFLVLQPLPW